MFFALKIYIRTSYELLDVKATVKWFKQSSMYYNELPKLEATIELVSLAKYGRTDRNQLKDNKAVDR